MLSIKLLSLLLVCCGCSAYRYSQGVKDSDADDIRRHDEAASSISVLVVTKSSLRIQRLASERFVTLGLPQCHVWDTNNRDFDYDPDNDKLALLSYSESMGDNRLHLIDFSGMTTTPIVHLGVNLSSVMAVGEFTTDRVRFARDNVAKKGLTVYSWNSKIMAGKGESVEAERVVCMTYQDETEDKTLVSDMAKFSVHGAAPMLCHAGSLIVSEGDKDTSTRSLHDIASSQTHHTSVVKRFPTHVADGTSRYLVNSSTVDKMLEFDADRKTDVQVAFDAITGRFWAARSSGAQSILIADIEESKVASAPLEINTPSWSVVDDIIRLSVHNNIACISFTQGSNNQLGAVAVAKLEQNEKGRVLATTFEVDSLIGAQCLDAKMADHLAMFATDDDAPQEETKFREALVVLVGVGLSIVALGIILAVCAVYMACTRRANTMSKGFERAYFRARPNGYDNLAGRDDDDEHLLGTHGEDEKKQLRGEEAPLILA